MIDERITETTDIDGNVVERTVERDRGPGPVTVNTAPQSGGGFGGILLVLLLIGAGAIAYFLFANSDSEVRKDNAVAEAADNVGAAAEKAGNAVEKAADKIAK